MPPIFTNSFQPTTQALFTNTRRPKSSLRLRKSGHFPLSLTRPRSGAGSGLGGFTLIELLVTIVIVGILVAVGFGAFNRGILKARQVETQSLGRTVGIGIDNFRAENFRPPNPPFRDDFDTVYGAPDSDLDTGFLVAVLMGREGSFQLPGGGDPVDAADINPNRTEFVDLPVVTQPRIGVWQENGRLYDSWGRQLMFVINSRYQEFRENNGERDEILFSWGLLEYVDTSPGIRAWAFISMGADGLKGREMSENYNEPNTTYSGSDDVISW